MTGCQKWVESVFCLYEPNLLRKQNYKADWKMAKGHRTKWSIHNWLMFAICINKLALKIMKRNEMTLLPTQYICNRAIRVMDTVVGIFNLLAAGKFQYKSTSYKIRRQCKVQCKKFVSFVMKVWSKIKFWTMEQDPN